jgi:hypothetical protein
MHHALCTIHYIYLLNMTDMTGAQSGSYEPPPSPLNEIEMAQLDQKVQMQDQDIPLTHTADAGYTAGATFAPLTSGTAHTNEITVGAAESTVGGSSITPNITRSDELQTIAPTKEMSYQFLAEATQEFKKVLGEGTTHALYSYIIHHTIH